MWWRTAEGLAWDAERMRWWSRGGTGSRTRTRRRLCCPRYRTRSRPAHSTAQYSDKSSVAEQKQLFSDPDPTWRVISDPNSDPTWQAVSAFRIRILVGSSNGSFSDPAIFVEIFGKNFRWSFQFKDGMYMKNSFLFLNPPARIRNTDAFSTYTVATGMHYCWEKTSWNEE